MLAGATIPPPSLTLQSMTDFPQLSVICEQSFKKASREEVHSVKHLHLNSICEYVYVCVCVLCRCLNLLCVYHLCKAIK